MVRGCRSWGREPCAEGKDHPGPPTGSSVPGRLFFLSLSTKQSWERSFQEALCVDATLDTKYLLRPGDSSLQTRERDREADCRLSVPLATHRHGEQRLLGVESQLFSFPSRLGSSCIQKACRLRKADESEEDSKQSVLEGTSAVEVL